MKVRDGLSRIVLAACLVCVAPAVLAQDAAAPTPAPDQAYPPEVKSLLEKVVPVLYSPYQEGLRDVRFEMHMPMMEMMGLTGVKFLFLWKAPDKTLFRIEGELPQPEMKAMMQNQMEKQAKQLADLMIVKPYLEKFKGHALTLSKDGDMRKLEVTATNDDLGFKKQTLWFDKDYVPVKSQTEVENPMMGGTVTETSTFQYDLYSNRKLIKSITSESSGGKQEIQFEYADVGKYHMLAKVTINSPQNPMGPMTIEFRDVKVDTKIDDSEFQGK